MKLFNYDGMKLGELGKSTEINFCDICYEVSFQSMGMECGHRYCYDCYKKYLCNKITLGPECVFTTCPRSTCKLIVPEELFKEVCNKE